MCECCSSHKRPVNEIIAVTGKGGTGKTTLVSLMTRILHSKGFSVLAVDADPAVSLTYALGCSPAKTIADCFKFRNKVGMDVALEALRDAWRKRKVTMADLDRFAKIDRVTNVMRPYLEMLT